MLVPLLILSLCTLFLDTTPTSTTKEDRVSLLVNGDLIIGILLPIHHQPKQKRSSTSGSLVCGDIREIYGIQRVEVTLRTIEKINKDHRLLPNVTLGVEIRDSCWYAPVALQQSIELIRDSITPPSPPAASCSNRVSYVTIIIG